MTIPIKLQAVHSQYFGEAAVLVRAPGRINIIGEHTDYNMGFVLPAAIDRGIYCTISKSQGSQCRVHALDFQDTHTFDLKDFTRAGTWPDYIMGVVHEILQTHSLDSGFDMTISGDIPLGAGLSSSAALECATAFAISTLYNLKIDRLDLVRIGLRAERHFVGLDCGIMDQYASFYGKRDSALLIDCMNESHRYVDLKLEDFRFLLINSMVVHDLADSAYNVRKSQCEEGVRAVRLLYPHVRWLREVSMDMLDRVSSKIDEVVYNRCAYVIRENERVLNVVDHLGAGALAEAGSALYDAHEDLRRHYDVTCPETDFLVELAAKTGKVVGARQTGGGFGGCTINMVPSGFVDEFKAMVSQSYQRQFGKNPEFIPVQTSKGVSQIPLNHGQ